MGLHTTPYGSFYVQRDLQTGEIIQVLPVQPKDTPDQLPSVGALGIDDHFIESRRATLEASTVRAADSQGRLQRELASAGGRRLLETGRAVIAQRDDHDHGHAQSQSSRSSPSVACPDGDVDMAYAQPSVAHAPPYQYASAPPPSSSPASSQTQHDRRGSRSSSSQRGSTMNVHYTHTHSEDPLQPPSLHMHPVRPWPESLRHEDTVSRRPTGTARASSHEDAPRRRDDRVSSRGPSSSSSSKRSSSRSCRDDHAGRSRRRSNSTAFSIGSMITDSEGGSTCSASEASTPTALSPAPDCHYTDMMDSLHKSSLPPPSFSTAPPPPAANTPNKQKTVWIIRTLEPRRMTPNGDAYDYEPQRVKTHVETHVAS